ARNATGVQTCALPIYLSRQPTAQLQLDKAIADKDAAQKKFTDIQNEFNAITEERDQYKQQATKLEALLKDKSTEFSRLEEIAQRSEERRVGKRERAQL